MNTPTQINSFIKELYNKFQLEVKNRIIYIVYNVKTSDSDQQDFFSKAELKEIQQIAEQSNFKCVFIEDENEFCNKAKFLNRNNVIILNLSRRGTQNNKKLLVTAYCDIHRLPIISSSGYTVNLCRNKVHFEQFLVSKTPFGIPTKCICSREIKNIYSEFLNQEVIIKDIQSSGSVSLNQNSVFTLHKNYRFPKQLLDSHHVIQPFLEGIEIEIPFIVFENRPIILGAYKINKGFEKIITEKLSNDFSYDLTPFDITPYKTQIMEALTFIVNEFYIETYGRVDFIINNQGCFIFDIATTPFFIEHTSFYQSVKVLSTFTVIDILGLLKIHEIYSSPQKF